MKTHTVNSTGREFIIDRRKLYNLICLKCGRIFTAKYRGSCPTCLQNIGVDIYEPGGHHNLLPIASALGTAAAATLGSVKSPRKSASSRENGKKGGRPRQTVNQYIAAVKKINPEITANVKCWPYPQAEQSRIEFSNGREVALVNTDMPGALIRVALDAPKPIEIAKAGKE